MSDTEGEGLNEQEEPVQSNHDHSSDPAAREDFRARGSDRDDGGSDEGSPVAADAGALGSGGSVLERHRSGDAAGFDSAATEALSLVSSSHATFHRGPLPPAHVLREYDDVVPGTAKRIIDWADSSITTRNQAIERTSQAESLALKAGALSGALFPYALLIATVIAAFAGLTAIAIIAGLAVMATVGPKIIEAARGRGSSEDDS